MSQTVIIVGPNLPAEAKATFHVHAQGCADLRRGWIRRYAASDESFPFTADSRFDVESFCYDFAPAETPGYKLGDFQSEFHFAPCVTLPERTVPTEDRLDIERAVDAGYIDPPADYTIATGDGVVIAQVRHVEAGGITDAEWDRLPAAVRNALDPGSVEPGQPVASEEE